jgi:hypothetical protein
MKHEIVLIQIKNGFEVKYDGQVSAELIKVNGVWKDTYSGITYFKTFDETWKAIMKCVDELIE